MRNMIIGHLAVDNLKNLYSFQILIIYRFSEVKQSMDNITSHIAIIKDMGNSFHDRLHYLPSADSDFKYVFIIRDPQLAMSSYRKASFGTAVSLGLCDAKPVDDFDLHVDDPYYYSPGGNFKNAYLTWRHVQDNLDPDPLIVDCEDFMANPKPFLQKICQVGGLEFHDGLLKWDASTDIIKTWKNPGGIPKMLGNSLGYFHQTAIKSSCFHFSKKEKPPLSSTTKDIQRAVADGTEYYNEMYELRYNP